MEQSINLPVGTKISEIAANKDTGEIFGPLVLPEWMFKDDLSEADLFLMSEDILFSARLRIAKRFNIDPSDTDPKMEAKVFLESIKAMINMDQKRQQFILWAMVQLEERNLLHYADEEFDTMEEMAQSIMHSEFEKNPKSSASFDWNFIATKLMPALKQYGFSTIKVLTMLTNDGKLRSAVSTLRFVMDHEEDPTKQQEQLTNVLSDVMNPDMGAQQMRDVYNKHHFPKADKISSGAASFFMLNDKGGGLAVIRIDNNDQLQALNRSTRGLLEDDNSQFMPRDIRVLAREMSTINKPIPVSLITPLTPEQAVDKMDENWQLSGTVPVALEMLISKSKEEIDEYLCKQICEIPLPITSYAITGVAGNTLILTVNLDGSSIHGK